MNRNRKFKRPAFIWIKNRNWIE